MNIGEVIQNVKGIVSQILYNVVDEKNDIGEFILGNSEKDIYIKNNYINVYKDGFILGLLKQGYTKDFSEKE